MSVATTKKWPETETQIAEPVVAWLEEMGWTVYQEVTAPEGRADIVAVRGRVVWAIEVKRTLSLALLAQGHAWKRRAHMVSVAYPGGRMDDKRRLAREFAVADGLGIVEVWCDVIDGIMVTEAERPAIRRRVLPVTLTEGQRTFAKAGNADGKFWSPFRETCARVTALVAEWPGLTMSEIVQCVDHHYASKQSARGSLLGWAEAGKIEGVHVRGGAKDEGAARLYPVGWHGPIEGRRLLAERVAARKRELPYAWRE